MKPPKKVKITTKKTPLKALKPSLTPGVLALNHPKPGGTFSKARWGQNPKQARAVSSSNSQKPDVSSGFKPRKTLEAPRKILEKP